MGPPTPSICATTAGAAAAWYDAAQGGSRVDARRRRADDVRLRLIDQRVAQPGPRQPVDAADELPEVQRAGGGLADPVRQRAARGRREDVGDAGVQPVDDDVELRPRSGQRSSPSGTPSPSPSSARSSTVVVASATSSLASTLPVRSRAML